MGDREGTEHAELKEREGERVSMNTEKRQRERVSWRERHRDRVRLR